MRVRLCVACANPERARSLSPQKDSPLALPPLKGSLWPDDDEPAQPAAANRVSESTGAALESLTGRLTDAMGPEATRAASPEAARRRAPTLSWQRRPKSMHSTYTPPKPAEPAEPTI